MEHVPASIAPGSLIVVSNHTSGADPLLIQAACTFEIRWMMASDLMVDSAAGFWKWRRIIPVARTGRDTSAAREAMAHVKAGGAIGIFPEGGTERPPGQIRPFLGGVGLIVHRTQAPVLLVWISGTPECERALEALRRRSHARVRFVDLIRYPEKTKAEEIVRDLRRRLSAASGWTLNDEILPSAHREEEDPFAP
jgi:1-acyl-sn-glycerol-3-phosphate acyltransferase